MSRMTKAQLQERLEVLTGDNRRLLADGKEIRKQIVDLITRNKTQRKRIEVQLIEAAESERLREPQQQPAGIQSMLDERGERYGDFRSHALMTQGLKAMMNGGMFDFMSQHGAEDRYDLEVHFHDAWYNLSSAHKEALEMIAHKIGRILNGDPNYDDSWLDIAGYAELGKQEAIRAMRAKAEERG